MDRTYLFVPPEEYAEVKALGAQWDTQSKRWYLGAEVAAAPFSRWLPYGDDDGVLTITSNAAYVAAAKIPCRECHAEIEVICIHCESGVVSDEPLTQFTVSDIWAMDEGLTQQLRPWPAFRKADSGEYANHCPHCGAPQGDLFLHSEPDSPFFDIPRAAPGAIKLTPLEGAVQLGGDEHFTVE